ncbi:MAG: nucleotide exchange factor GrpE [Candidatus Dormibacteraeota bacterium]|nr:nucleotide exchange factor GrpE [Candidatus Dormibacteraeota bacterium]
MPTKRTDHDATEEPRPSAAEGGTTAEATADGSPGQEARELASELEEANSRLLRVAADFDNYRKRARQEQLDTMRYASATLAERLLPVLDDAQRTLEHVPEGVDEGWLKGLQMTFRQLEEVLGSVGVERIDALGQRFDPGQHEAIGSVESDEDEEDTVVGELRPGYRIHDRVLRPALVRVARRPA